MSNEEIVRIFEESLDGDKRAIWNVSYNHYKGNRTFFWLFEEIAKDFEYARENGVHILIGVNPNLKPTQVEAINTINHKVITLNFHVDDIVKDDAIKSLKTLSNKMKDEFAKNGKY